MMRILWLLPVLVFSVAQARLDYSALDYEPYQQWRHDDKLFFSTFNAGEQWKNWKTSQYTLEPLNLVDQINLCYEFEGGWNHYFGDCVIEDEDMLVQYVEAVEEAQRFGWHFSAPALNKTEDPDLTTVEPENLDWENYDAWSPQQRLHFSTFGEKGE